VLLNQLDALLEWPVDWYFSSKHLRKNIERDTDVPRHNSQPYQYSGVDMPKMQLGGYDMILDLFSSFQLKSRDVWFRTTSNKFRRLF
jgi:hypothetical protein